MPARRYLSLSEAAEYLGINVRTLRRAIADGRIDGYRIGDRIVRVDLDQIEQSLLIKIPTAVGR
ncbi:helix-turn-helix transcriptional regulator [Microlunatus parietis]|uniref:Excisionase family DNA binding protein n=1 Tax=Microlunatus parietis TaxID=682979 RepID=A0A7Y9IBD0_9ACTN|nr:helix-turn-helix domain-containing protein [Microlunatus parietis]NYE73582.1 excisionase family DNA binding protein [Microlunatus parietis]